VREGALAVKLAAALFTSLAPCRAVCLRAMKEPATSALSLSVRACALALALALIGCSAPSYLFQAAQGQLDLLCRARPIERAIADPATPERVRALLKEVPSIKKFGVGFGLTPTSSYQSYVALDRPRVVYVTSASDPLAFKGRRWRFPIVGSVPYLGWFDHDDAKRFAEELASQGLDVDLRGASAYSTLGWFSDPVLSSMLPESPSTLGSLVDVVLHESVHATVYVPGQSTFNESLAEYVSDDLTEEYLRSQGLIAELSAYRRGRTEGATRRRRMHEAYKTLEALYASPLPREEKLAQKAKILSELRAELGFGRPLNNATLLESRTYGSESDAFDKLFKKCGSWDRFWKALRSLDPASFGGDQATRFSEVLARLGEKSCG
jgi:predicted aminopeptidase